MNDYIGTATYSPDDNKLRLYPFSRLDAATFERVKAAGFRWAPKQEVFVAPAWTPQREDLLLELAGEIKDEDTSLVDRAEQRAERFEDYSDHRQRDGDAASKRSHDLISGIPPGQPILVGHHSERGHRAALDKSWNALGRAVKNWETADYWKQRAASAVAHAKYKELPAVRSRRIKTIEADKRAVERSIDETKKALAFWVREDLTHEECVKWCNYNRGGPQMPRKEGDREDFTGTQDAYGALTNSFPNLYAPRTLEEVIARARQCYSSTATRERWVNHYNNRLAYERAMLDEQGGNATNKYDLQPGGRVLCSGDWYTIVRVNKKGGEAVSVRVNAKYRTLKNVGEILGYEPPSAEATAAMKQATKLAPMCNYPCEGVTEITAEQWKRAHNDYKGSQLVEATETTTAHRVRRMMLPGYRYGQVFITDEKRKDPPPRELNKPDR